MKQNCGYDPFYPSYGGTAILLNYPGEGSKGCSYNSGGAYGTVGVGWGVFPDGTLYKQEASELRQYILQLEATRRLQDLSNVDFGGQSPQPQDFLAFNSTTGNWELVDYASGGEW
jgi:hypothetical protein